MHTYQFGELVPTFNVFAYPRTGSRFFYYWLTGLFDLLAFAHPHLYDQEAIDRANELNQEALYMLSLREPTARWQPVYFNARSTGTHGLAAESEFPMIVLIRDPIAAAYSRYRVDRDRWGGNTEVTKEWLHSELSQYSNFYCHSLDVLAHEGERGLLLRWEDLVAGPEALERLVTFTRQTPKLRPSLVWSLTRFENFVRPGKRTFYRSGVNSAWRDDSKWLQALCGMEFPSFEGLGYTSIAERLATMPLEPKAD